MQARVTVSGFKAAGYRFDQIEQNAVHAKPLMEDWYLAALNMIEETFDSEGARAGFPMWQELTPTWLYEKTRPNRKGGPGDPRILRDSGAMFDALTEYKHPDVYVRIENLAVIIRPKDKLLRARVHMAGSKKVKGQAGIPARPWIRVGQTDKELLGRQLVHWIKTGTLM